MRKTLNVVGYVLLAVAFVGLASPASLGTHAGLPHNGIHGLCGVLALYFAQRDERDARAFCGVLGLALVVLGGAGLIFGEPGSPFSVVSYADPRLLRLIPGRLEFGTADHVLHALAGLACLIAGSQMTPERPLPAARVRGREPARL